MKLRNKRTGEIVDADFNATISGRTNIIIIQNGPEQLEYGSLAELNEKWEDYEEPKEYWYINFNLECIDTTDDDTETDGYHKSIGNYFDTREEAEKAVEKLKAWKRLKDKGFRFNSCSIEHYVKQPRGIIAFELNDYDNKLCKDLDLLFSGGEE